MTLPVDPRSQHPVDILIRQLVATRRLARPSEVGAIIERMATAPFNSHMVRVPLSERGVEFQGQTLADREPSLRLHLYQRVVIDGQWREGTSADEYLADLRRAVRLAGSGLVVYPRRGGDVALVIASTDQAVPITHLGPSPEPLLAVFYSADRGIVVSAYQSESVERLSVPEDAQWLA